MPAGANDTTVSWGTMDANGTSFHTQLANLITDLQNLGVPGVQDILNKYGVKKTDFGSCNIKFLKPDKTGFLGG